jgi:hypothetical protein
LLTLRGGTLSGLSSFVYLRGLSGYVLPREHERDEGKCPLERLILARARLRKAATGAELSCR